MEEMTLEYFYGNPKPCGKCEYNDCGCFFKKFNNEKKQLRDLFDSQSIGLAVVGVSTLQSKFIKEKISKIREEINGVKSNILNNIIQNKTIYLII